MVSFVMRKTTIIDWLCFGKGKSILLPLFQEGGSDIPPAMLADLGQRLDDLGAVRALHAVLFGENPPDGQFGLLADLGVEKLVRPDRIDAAQVV